MYSEWLLYRHSHEDRSILPFRTTNTRRHSTLVLALASGLALTACSSGAEPAEPAEELSPQERIEQEAGVTIEAGAASCSFNNEIDEYQWDGSGEHPLGQLDTAEIRETADAYEVTFTGDFFDPSLVAEDTYVTTQLTLTGADDNVALYTSFRKGELDSTGTMVDGEVHELETGAALEPGMLSASFPKNSPDFAGFTPEMWFASIYYDGGDESLNPVSFRCGDGRNWNWEPLGS